MGLAHNIADLRVTAGLTQQELADRVGVSRSAVAQWETDRGSPQSKRLPKLAETLNTNLQTLFQE
ncbi:MAG: helix-turn-helix transcriptional regulator [Rhodopila sp.]|nr:helix-turn-helix transcriptional regulator [Rhodopila sp.]